MQKSSEKDIAKRNNVSSNHVNRILNKISEDKLVKNNGTLPEKFGIDEFNATKDTISKMAFIIVNQDNKNISKKMKKALKTFNNMEKYILNSFDYKYSNGIVEGTNNVIKQN